MMSPEEYVIMLIGSIIEMGLVCMLAYYLYGSRHDNVRRFDGSWNTRNIALMIVFFGIAGVISTHYFSFYVDGARINVKDFVALVSGFIGGPFVGIGSGAIIGVERFLQGGPTALPCALAPIIAGAVGGIIWHFGKEKYPKIWVAAISMLVIEVIHVLMINYISDPMSAGHNAASIMGFAIIDFNLLCVVAFSLIYRLGVNKANK